MHSNVRAGLHERRHALGIVAGVDARTHHVALVRVQHLVGVGLVRVVVLAKHERHQAVVRVHDGQGVQLVVPDYVVGSLERGVGRRNDEFLARGHEVRHLLVQAHARQPIVAAGHDAQKLAVRGAVVGNGHGGVAVFLLERHHVAQRHVGREVGIGGDEAGLVVFDARDHGRLVGDGLVAVDERQAALGGQRHSHAVVGHGGHDGRHHGDVKRKRALLLAFAVFHKRSLQAHGRRHARCRRMPRNQQVLVEGTGRLVEIVGHGLLHLRSAWDGCRPSADLRAGRRPLIGCYPLL